MTSSAVRIRARDQDLGPAQVLWLDPQRIRVKRHAVSRPLASGTSAEVVFMDASGAAVIVPAVADTVREVKGGSVVDLVFVEADPVAPKAERRSSVRVVPAPGTPLEVYLETDEEGAPPVRVHLVDIGVGGLCIDLPAIVARPEMRLQVLLPSECFPLVVPVRIVYQRPIGAGRMRYGVEICWAGAPDPAEQSLLLIRWVSTYRALVAGRLQTR